MNLELIGGLVEEFCSATHGSTDYYKDDIFIQGANPGQFVPFKFLKKKIEGLESLDSLLKAGYCFTSFEYSERSDFKEWFEKQFSRKLEAKMQKDLQIVHKPNVQDVFKVLQSLDQAYDKLREEDILLNSKNLPVQLGEWFAKSIFGLKQMKSTSQRGFDFYLQSGNRIEVKIYWKEQSSLKGAKVKKSLVDLSEFVCIVYLAKNFTIRDICVLDSNFVMRKFATKGHTVFLKDPDLAPYFFSKSSKHFDKIMDKSALMKFASPTFAMKLDDRL